MLGSRRLKSVGAAAVPAAWPSTRARPSSRPHAVLLPVLRGGRHERRYAAVETVVILGSGGPNRIGQGIEFDYCCVHAAQAFHKLGYDAVMLNSNPETVSTDYDTSDRLYLEPVTLERCSTCARSSSRWGSS